MNNKNFEIQNKNLNKTNNSKLPNIWDLVELFIKANHNIKYCMTYKTFFWL